MRILAAIAVMSLLLLYVGERVDVVRVGYHVERLKLKKVAIQREHDELRVTVSKLTSPERIERAATDRLGMVPPRQGQVILVRLEPDAPSDRKPGRPEVRLASHGPREPGLRIP